MNKNILKVFTAGLLAFSLAGCGSKSDSKTITVGATTSPHAIILKHVQPEFEKAGYKLKIKEFSDYPNINPSTSDDSLDANFFQHQPYLTSYNKDKGYKKGDDGYLVSVGAIHFEPLGLYSTKYKAVSDIKDGSKIAIPNDATNEARALLLLESNGIIKLREDATITATINDIVENPYGIEFKEIEAAQLPNYLRDVDYAIINSNYAISAGLNPITDSILIEGGGSCYANILAVKDGNQENPLVLALLAALNSRQVKDFIDKKYQGSVVSTVENLTDGYDASIDYSALENQTITVACSPTPHGEILNIAKDILASKNITLDIKEYNDYIIPNTVVEDGTILANYFQHLPYLEDFNKNNNTHIVSVGAIHVEPMGLYGGKQTGLDKIYDQNK